MKLNDLDILTESTSNKRFFTLLKKAKFGIKFDKEYNDSKVALGDAVHMDEDGTVFLDGEHEHTAGHVIDYYGEFRDGLPYISQEVEAFAEKHGKYCEWRDPGSISFYN